MLRLTASLSWNKAPIWGFRPYFYYCQTLAGLLLWSALTRGQVCRLQLLLVLASAVILESESRGTREPYFTVSDWRLPFCRLLRLSGLRWRYSTPPPHRNLHSLYWLLSNELFFIITLHGPNRKHRFRQYPYCFVFTDPLFENGFYCCARVHFRGNLLAEPLPSNKIFRLSGVMLQYEDVLCIVMMHSLIYSYKHLGPACLLNIEGRKVKTDAESSAEMSVTIYQITRRIFICRDRELNSILSHKGVNNYKVIKLSSRIAYILRKPHLK
jgi:hypothetical protein